MTLLQGTILHSEGKLLHHMSYEDMEGTIFLLTNHVHFLIKVIIVILDCMPYLLLSRFLLGPSFFVKEKDSFSYVSRALLKSKIVHNCKVV